MRPGFLYNGRVVYYLSLGSNLGRRRRNLRRAAELLAAAGIRILRRSSIYRTEPVDLRDQPWFFNQVLAVETRLGPAALLRLIQAVEAAAGRGPGVRKGPRVLDIDILLAGRRIIKTPRLAVPHPRLARRRFVLVPLAEIAPAVVHPVLRKTAAALLACVPDRSAVRKLPGQGVDSRSRVP